MEVECFVTTEEIYQMIQELRKQAQKEQTENKITDNTEKEKTENTDISEEQNIDVALLFACERSIEMVKNYCYIEQIPTELKNVCVEIALLLYDNGGYQSKNTTLKSIKEGNVALTYQSESSAWKENKKTLLKEFSEELDRFRKLKW